MASTEVSLTEMVAGIACRLQERIALDDDSKEGEDGYFYAPFGGFPGWYRFCAECGRLSEQAFWSRTEEPDWIEFMDDTAERIWKGIFDSKGPPDIHSLIR